MGIKARVMTKFGEKRDCYVRINNVDDVQNNKDGTTVKPRLRAYLDSFENGKPYVWDSVEADLKLEFIVDISKPLWDQIYEELIKDEAFKSALEIIDTNA